MYRTVPLSDNLEKCSFFEFAQETLFQSQSDKKITQNYVKEKNNEQQPHNALLSELFVFFFAFLQTNQSFLLVDGMELEMRNKK